MGDILSAAGSIAGGAMNASAIKNATADQIAALERARDYVYTALDPSVIGSAATAADVQRTEDRLALQAKTDPALLRLRYQSQNDLLNQAGQIGQGNEQMLAEQAAQEIMQSGAATNSLRDRLMQSAQQELDLGATLPPDLQAELVRTGLEKAGMVSGAASPKGFGGTLVRKELGAGAIKLQADRQARASAMAGTAASLEAQRQQILGTLFPNLNSMKISNLGATAGALNTSNQLVPEAGLGGSDIANLWLGRVGATNQINQSAADASARGATGAATAWNQAIGAGTGYLANAAPSSGSTWSTVKGWFSGGSGSGSNGDYLGET
jgi:hypothetical protein